MDAREFPDPPTEDPNGQRRWVKPQVSLAGAADPSTTTVIRRTGSRRHTARGRAVTGQEATAAGFGAAGATAPDAVADGPDSLFGESDGGWKPSGSRRAAAAADGAAAPGGPDGPEGPDGLGGRRIGGARRRGPGSRRRWPLVVVGVAVLLIACGAVLAYQVMKVKSDLASTSNDLTAVQDAATSGDIPTAKARLSRVIDSAHAARSHSAGPVWWAASYIPFAGPNLRTSRQLVLSLADLADGPLTDMVSVSDTISPDSLIKDSTIDVPTLVKDRPTLLRAAAGVATVDKRMQSLPSAHLVGPVATARTQAVTKIAKLDKLLSGMADALTVGPEMLGANGTRTYFLAFQNNAEIKSTGGLLGVYGILTADHGKITLVHTGSNDELKNFKKPVVDFGPEYNANYGSLFPGSLWSNGNSSPNFPYAGQTWATMYERQTGTHIDGVIGVDPEMLADLVRATGPITLSDGTKVGGDSVAKLVEVDAYADFHDSSTNSDERSARKDFLKEVADTAFHTALSSNVKPKPLVTELNTAAKGGHLQIWTPIASEMTILRKGGLTGEMYQGTAPYASVVLNNVSGAKLEYYLQRNVSYTLGSCSAGRRPGQIQIGLTNLAPPGLPRFVWQRIDAPPGSYPQGQDVLQLSVYLTDGAKLVNVMVNGKAVDFTRGTELGHPRIMMWVFPTPGQPLTVTVNTDEPATSAKPIVPAQPMARPQQTEIKAAACG
jgi:hypothetical protein